MDGTSVTLAGIATGRGTAATSTAGCGDVCSTCCAETGGKQANAADTMVAEAMARIDRVVIMQD